MNFIPPYLSYRCPLLTIWTVPRRSRAPISCLRCCVFFRGSSTRDSRLHALWWGQTINDDIVDTRIWKTIIYMLKMELISLIKNFYKIICLQSLHRLWVFVLFVISNLVLWLRVFFLSFRAADTPAGRHQSPESGEQPGVSGGDPSLLQH